MSVVESPSAKRARVQYRRHHVPLHKLQKLPMGEPAIIDQEVLDKLLIDSIKAICEEQGNRQAINDPFIDSLALEALRNLAEECVTFFFWHLWRPKTDTVQSS